MWGGVVSPEQARALFLEHCQPSFRSALERYGEKAAVAAILAAVALGRETLIDRLYDELGDCYDCTRVWSAWSYGTMGEDDFTPARERVADIVDGLLAPETASVPA